MVWRALIGTMLSLLVIWVALAAALALAARRYGFATLAQLLRLLPDVLRLLGRLARDRNLPRGARMQLWLLLGYLALPFDLIPDVIPVIGYADDVIVVVWVLRRVLRGVGVAVLRRHWPGKSAGMDAVLKLCRVGY
ncbi:MAG: hypothetical protein DLM55_11530 [Acidimicrobiales bacterium]|nr:MAG: hypothetical protein DLM55_11530 [Acidimicrobiales bacterium]